ncbi:hypothetical protein Ndes2526B_g02142 [Nannochloris sp. 'desiccata']|nr:hypothetical protein KSW81_003497 [Chlorella desiccata (nom. nud.)]
MSRFSTRGDANSLLIASSSSPGTSQTTPLFASLGWGMFGAMPSGALSIKEKRTGVDFPAEFCFRKGQRNCPTITGAGSRVKKIAGIKSLDIYALGLYVDQKAAHALLNRRFANKKSSPEKLAKDPALFTELCKADNIEKSLVLVMTSKLVNKHNFLQALEDRLTPPLTKLKELAALEDFKRQFDGVDIKKGLKISFNFTKGKVVTKAGDKELSTLSNKALVSNLLDSYLGNAPVSPRAKEEFAAGLAQMLVS